MRRIILAVLFMVAIMAANSIAETNVLVLTGNRASAEFPVLSTFTDIEGEKVAYEQTNDRSLPGLDDVDIIWIGQGEICENSYFFNEDTENTIKGFVEGGGIVISMGQDSDGGRACEVGWITAPMVGIERGSTSAFVVTNAPEVGDLFTVPNEVNSAHFDDAWTQPDAAFIMLATINGQDIGFALLQHGKGWYLVTSVENEDAGDVTTNTPIMENLIYYAIGLSQGAAVEYRGKLATTWAGIKN